MRKKNKLITGAITIFSLFSSNLEAKAVNTNAKAKNDKNAAKNKKVKITKAKNVQVVTTKNKNTKSKVVHTTATTTNLTTGIYRISARNSSPLVKAKMAELHGLHSKMLTKGSKFEKNRATIQRKLLSSYSRWLGTPYAWGGDSKSGIDCSALTRRVYRETFGIELPRTAAEQVQKGKRVSASNLRPGDIVFFKTNGTTNHTAVYVGNSLFINASSSKGVVMSSLESPYWKKYFKYGVRVNGLNT